ncbi:hypothetical protein WJX84_000857, partial [Apatococcus fuscideae]
MEGSTVSVPGACMAAMADEKAGWVTTLVEILSPIILVSMLVVAYEKVEEDQWPERIYVQQTRSAIERAARQFHLPDDTSSFSGCINLLQGLNLTEIAGEIGQSGASGPPWNQSWVPSGAFPPSPAGASGQSIVDCLMQEGRAVGQAAPQFALAALQALLNTRGPLPVPTFDEFVSMHNVLQLALESQPDVLGQLRGARRSLGWNMLGNLLDMGQLAFAPNSPDVLRFVDYMQRTHPMFADVFYGIFETEAAAEAYATFGDKRLWALVTFHEGPSAAAADYTIRMNYTTVPKTWKPVNKRVCCWAPSDYKYYYTSGFLSIQAAVDNYALGLSASLDTSLGPLPLGEDPQGQGSVARQSWTEWGGLFPTVGYIHNGFFDAVGPMLGLVMSLSLVYPLAMMVRGVVEEKETRARETMFIMGLRPWVLACSWVLAYGMIFTAVAAVITTVCCLTFLSLADPSLLFTLLWLFTASELAFGLLLTVFFSNAKVAGIVAPLAHFAALLPRYIFFRTGEPQAMVGKVFVSLLSPTAFTFSADL